MSTDTPDPKRPQRGVLLRALNGDVIGFDETGVRLNLADSVIADIRKRLGDGLAAQAPVDPAILGDLNAWDVRELDGWYVFHARLPGAQPTGAFCRPVEAIGDAIPSIIAAPSAALYGILALGGARHGMTSDIPVRFPFHVISTADDMGAAGPAGTLDVAPNDRAERLNEQTRDTMTADEIIARRMDAYRALPVIYVRGETDSSSSVAALSKGKALANFKQTVANFCATAKSLRIAPKVLAVPLDFTLEAVEDDAKSWHRGMYALMQNITDVFAMHGLRKPLFVAQFEAGTHTFSDSPIIRAQWDLAWNKGGHDLVFAAPSYMFALDDFGRPTHDAQREMAEMEAFAIEAENADEPWACPILLLAEREADPHIIRCKAQVQGDLVCDDKDPLNAGPACGFALSGCTNDAQITQVAVAPDAAHDLLIHCDVPPEGAALHLTYAIGAPASKDGMPANRGALRDSWEHQGTTGRTLHRWALPAALPVH